MKKTRTLTAAMLLGLVAFGDWFLMDTTADPETLRAPGVAVEGATLTGSIKDGHALLEVNGEGRGTVTVRLTETPILMYSRMMPMPKTLWERPVAFDTTEGRSLNLGELPKGKTSVNHQLLASTDGKSFVPLASHYSQLQ